jgi:hypothetical protein
MATNRIKCVKSKKNLIIGFEPMIILFSDKSYPNKKSLFKGCDVQEASSKELYNMGKSESEFTRDICFGKDIIYSLNLRPKGNQTKHLTVIKNFKPSLLSAIALTDFFGYVLVFKEFEDTEAYGEFHRMIARLRMMDNAWHYNHNLADAVKEFELMLTNASPSDKRKVAAMVKKALPSDIEFESLIQYTYQKMFERLGSRL